MARIVGGFGSSHTPLMSVPGELWHQHARRDPNNPELVQPSTGKRVPYEELLAGADPAIAKQIDDDIFVRKFNSIQKGLDELQERFAATNPDVVVMFGDDQGEFFFDDNYPMINL